MVPTMNGKAFKTRNPGRSDRPGFCEINDFWYFGAGEGIRTLDPNLGKVVLYP